MHIDRSRALIELGERLVAALELEHDDMLAAWMCHYIAEVMTAAEAATGSERIIESERCARAILDLWGHRHVLPMTTRPVVQMASVARALASLDPESEALRYHPSSRPGQESEDGDADTQKWTEMAVEVDYIARVLVTSCLSLARREALRTEGPWLRLALAAGAEESPEHLVLSTLGGEAQDGELRKHDREALVALLSRIDLFVDLASDLAGDIRDELRDRPAHVGEEIALPVSDAVELAGADDGLSADEDDSE